MRNANSKIRLLTQTLKLKTMKNNYLKLVVLGFIMMIGSTIQAQTTVANAGTANTTQANKAGETIRLIDNKGTIKYMQSNNGITTITSTAANNRTTTTWQLGGTLLESTYIDVSGNVFALDGIKLLTPTTGAGLATTPSSAATAADLSVHGGAGTGWTVLIRDESTGETQKILASDLITAGRVEFTIVNDDDLVITAAGLVDGTPISKISVYRNGAKLRAGVDYTLTDDDEITLDNTAVAPNNWSTFAGDIIEVQWVF